ncbi:MAG: hypothetical protein IPL53_13860 [Ignavibacteria bacterium]|nr:hypothetical protein [Ignavibacteria bacterium]
MDEKIDLSQNSIEYTYKEYVRLSERCASYVESSFADIKLYAAIGTILTWGPISDKFFSNDPRILFTGFVAIYTVITVLTIYNIIKQSLVVYYLQTLPLYEDEIQKKLGTGKKIFNWSETYLKWRKEKVIKIYLHLVPITFLILIVFPVTMMLNVPGATAYAIAYAGVALLFSAITISAMKIIYEGIFAKKRKE